MAAVEAPAGELQQSFGIVRQRAVERFFGLLRVVRVGAILVELAQRDEDREQGLGELKNSHQPEQGRRVVGFVERVDDLALFGVVESEPRAVFGAR